MGLLLKQGFTWLLLLYTVTVNAVFPAVKPGDDAQTATVKKVLQTWNLNGTEIQYDNHLWRKDISSANHRIDAHTKLSNQFSVSQYCNMPGYTGANCEFPLCEQTNNDIPLPDSQVGLGTMTDAIMLANCSSSMTTVLDSEMSEIYISIESDQPVEPTFMLYSRQGTRIYPMQESSTSNVYSGDFAPQTPGTYVIQAVANSDVDGKCFVIVRAVTRLLTSGGFISQTDNTASDRNDFPKENPVAYQPSTFVVHAENLLNPGSLVTVTVYENFNIMARPQQLLTRYNCGYEYFIEHFYCKNSTQSYYYRVDGIDFYGNKFRRIGTFICLAAITSQPPISSTPVPGPVVCKNDAALMTDTDGSKYCYCTGLFHGRDCGDILCMNGGTGLNNAVCLCLPGFSGDHCQDVQCIETTTFGFGTDNPTLILVFHIKNTMKNPLQQIQVQLRNIYEYYQTVEASYLRRFAVLMFNNNKIIKTFTTMHFDDINETLSNTVLEETNNCDDSVFTAVEMALSTFLVTNRSPMYVFTDALPNDETEFETIFHLNSYWKAPIYLFLIEPPDTSGCTLDLYHNAFTKLRDMTKRTSGHLFFIPRNKTNRVGMLFSTHMVHVFHRSSLIHSYDTQYCQLQPQYQPISVDKRLNEIVVTAVGRDLSLITVDPKGNTTKQQHTFNINNIYFWSLRNPQLGQWMFSINSKTLHTECSYRIYSTQTRSGERSEYDLFWGFSPGVIWDAPFIQPVENEALAFVAHMNNYVLNDASKVFAELIVYKETENGQENVFASNGIWRDKCNYQFYFRPMTCTHEDEVLYYSIFVRDELGTMIQRGGVAYCAKDHPTLSPPTSCMNGGVELKLDNNIVCLCTPDWSGQKCEVPVCYNGATAQNSGGAAWCRCSAGYTGTHCETVTCLVEGPEEPFSPLNRDLAFVVDMTVYASYSLHALKDYISSLIRDIEMHHREWIANYVLVGYNSTWAEVIAVGRRHQQEYFINAIGEAFDKMAEIMDSGCNTKVYHAIGEALEFIRADSHVIVIHASGTALDSQVIDIDFELLKAKRISLNVFYAYETKNGVSDFKCNAVYADYEALNELAEVNQGRAYPVDNNEFHKVLPMISTFYLSGEVYRRVLDHCEDKVNIYFPVDSFTQTVQVTAIGYNNRMTVFRPDGTEFSDVYNFIDDGKKTGWQVAEYRRACDLNNDWEASGPHYCTKFRMDLKTWDEAAQFCHDQEAFMVDELNSQKTLWLQEMSHGLVEFWIGLHRADNGKFYWDTVSGATPVQFNNSLYEVWDNNEPSLEPSKRCVFHTTKGKWKMAECSRMLRYACQRHKYDPTFEPSDILDDLIMPGKWRIEVQTDPAPIGSKWPIGGCEVEVRVQSNVQVFPNYVIDQHSDVAIEGAVEESDQNRIISHIYGDSYAVLRYANLYNYETMALEKSATYQKREMCVYPWVTQNWRCPEDFAGTRFAVIHSGSDRNGQTFQRMTTGTCMHRDCENGFSSHGKCICMDYWTGTRCETPQCVNDGKLDSDNNVCKCPEGYTGNACQYAECLPQVPTTFSNDNKTFILVVELTEPNRNAIQQLASNVDALVQDVIAKHRRWFSNILLVTMNSREVLSNEMFTTTESFSRAVQQLPDEIEDPGTVCGAPLYAAITSAARTSGVVSPNSVLLTITRSVANDYSNSAQEILAGALSIARPQLYYLVVDDNERVCGYTAEHPNVYRMSAFALATGGNFFIIPKDKYINFLLIYLPTLYSTTLLITPTIIENSCKQATWYAQVDYYTEYMYITVFTAHGAFGIMDPQSDITPYEIIYENKKTTILKVDTTYKPGIYTLKVTSPTLCYAQIRGSSPLTIWPGYVWNSNGNTVVSHVDKPEMFPVHGNKNTLIFHLSGEEQPNARLTYTELINPYDGTVLILPLYRRYNCSYEFYTDPFDCPDEDFLVMVNGVDDRGQNFRREVELTQCRDNTNANVKLNGNMTPNKRSISEKVAASEKTQSTNSQVPDSISRNAVTSSLFVLLSIFLSLYH